MVRVVISHAGYIHRLQGMDRYWWTDHEFGMFNVDRWQYQGRQSASWRCIDRRIVSTGGLLPPDGATVIEGHMVSDVRAAELGLL